MKKTIYLTLVLSLAALLSACGTVVNQLEGEQRLGQRLSVQLPTAWNRFVQDTSVPYQVWTQEGLVLDQLRIWAALQAGQALIQKPAYDGKKEAQLPTFSTGLRPDQWVGLLEAAYAADGSVVSIEKVEPVTWAGARAVRFEFALARRGDDLALRGVGWATEKDQAFYAAVFTAPSLHFFGHLLPQVQALMRTARFVP
jgi:hypothetical protein